MADEAAPAGDAPQAHGLIGAAGGEVRAVGRDGQVVDGRDVTAHDDAVVVGDVPDAHELIFADADEAIAVAEKADGDDAGAVPVQRVHHAALAVDDDDAAAAGAEGERVLLVELQD